MKNAAHLKTQSGVTHDLHLSVTGPDENSAPGVTCQQRSVTPAEENVTPWRVTVNCRIWPYRCILQKYVVQCEQGWDGRLRVGGGRVGGGPYLDTAKAVMAGLFLRRRWAPFWLLLSSLHNTRCLSQPLAWAELLSAGTLWKRISQPKPCPIPVLNRRAGVRNPDPLVPTKIIEICTNAVFIYGRWGS